MKDKKMIGWYYRGSGMPLRMISGMSLCSGILQADPQEFD